MTYTGTFSDAYPSRWLKADLIPDDKDLILTVKDIVFEPVGADKEMKLILSFVEDDHELVLNMTNAGILAQLYGQDPSSVVGKRIALYAEQVTFAGKAVMGVRIRLKADRGSPAASAQRQQTPPPPPPLADDDPLWDEDRVVENEADPF